MTDIDPTYDPTGGNLPQTEFPDVDEFEDPDQDPGYEEIPYELGETS